MFWIYDVEMVSHFLDKDILGKVLHLPTFVKNNVTHKMCVDLKETCG